MSWRPKYKGRVANAQKTLALDGTKCDSKLEAYMYNRLKKFNIPFAFQRKYILQPKFKHDFDEKTTRAITWTPDFVFEWCDLVVDTKGYATDVAELKMKIFRYQHPDLRLETVQNKKQADSMVIWLKSLYVKYEKRPAT